MWWVAWRLHRRLLLGWVTTVGVVVVAQVAVRRAFLAPDPAAPCWDYVLPDGSRYCPNPLQLAMIQNNLRWEALHAAVVVAPVVAGLLGGVALFATEFDRGTQVLALSQSVTRLRWFTVLAVTVTVPLVVGAAVLGTVTAATRSVVTTYSKEWYDHFEFATSGVVAAALCLLGVSVGCVAGLVLRSPLPALMAGLVAVTAVIGVVSVYRSSLATPVRTATPITGNELENVPENSWTIGGGLLDANGAEVGYPPCPTFDESEWERCAVRNDITAFWVDSIPLERRGALQATVAALLAAIATSGFAAGILILRRRRTV